MKVTLYGLAGTGTSSVGKMLAQELNLKYLSPGIIFRSKAEERGLTLSELHEIAADDPRFDNEVDQEVEKFGKENDNFIAESRLPWYFIPDSIKIKLFCDFDERIRRVAIRDDVSFEEAKQHSEKREEADALRYKKFYGIDDMNNDSHFDIAIDTTHIPASEVVLKIKEFLNSKKES